MNRSIAVDRHLAAARQLPARQLRNSLVALAVVVTLVGVSGCTTSSGPYAARHAVCANPGTSIARVDVTVLAAPPGSNVGIEIPHLMADGSWLEITQHWVDQPLEVGRSYVVRENPYGMVDAGRCVTLIMTSGTQVNVTTYPAVINGRWLYYLFGFPAATGQITG